MKNTKFKIAFLGDIFLGNDDIELCQISVIKKCDLVFANFEGSFFNGPKRLYRGSHLRSNPDNLKILSELNIKALSLANNHILDYGLRSALKTKSLFLRNNIGTTGFGISPKEANIEFSYRIKNKKISFLAFTFPTANIRSIVASWCSVGCASGRLTNLKRRIREVKESSDLVFIYFHWGYEYLHIPEKKQQKLARTCIDLGADGVFGSHAHVIQADEIYKGRPIYYGLGNFIFSDYENISGEKYHWKGIENISLVPILTYDLNENKLIKSDHIYYKFEKSKLKPLSKLEENKIKKSQARWNEAIKGYSQENKIVRSFNHEIRLWRLKRWKLFPMRVIERFGIWPLKIILGEPAVERLRVAINKNYKKV